MKIWKKEINVEIVNARANNSMSSHVGIEYMEVGDDYLLARMPVNEKTLQPFGIMHGGASCVLAESVGSAAAIFCVDEFHHCVGLDINTNHIRAISSGFVWGTAKPFHLGQSTQVWGINITDESQRLISVTRLTVAVLKLHKDGKNT